MYKETQTYKKLKETLRSNNPDKIILHHTGGSATDNLADTSHHTANGVEKTHLALGWDGIGYHYFIEKDGTVWKGRPHHYHGAHTIPENKTSIGICLAGNFNATLPSKEQETALLGLVNELGIDNVAPHRKYWNTDCFGTNLPDNWFETLSREIVTVKSFTDMVKAIQEEVGTAQDGIIGPKTIQAIRDNYPSNIVKGVL